MRLLLALFLVATLPACQSTGAVGSFGSDLDKALGGIAGAVSQRDKVTGVHSLNLRDDASTHQRAQRVVNQMLEEYRAAGIGPLPHHHRVYKRAKRVYDRVVAASHFAHSAGLQFYVLNKDEINAGTPGGGIMFVNRGLVEIATDAELAYVIGHELAHDAANHISESEAHHLVKGLLDRNRAGYETTFNNVQEQEADEIGILYTALAGYDPYASVRIQEKMQSSIATLARFHSHPTSYERTYSNRATAKKVYQYFQPGRRNPNYAAILQCNSLYCQKQNTPAVGDGGGTQAFFEVLLDAAVKYAEAEAERRNQQNQAQLFNKLLGR